MYVFCIFKTLLVGLCKLAFGNENESIQKVDLFVLFLFVSSFLFFFCSFKRHKIHLINSNKKKGDV